MSEVSCKRCGGFEYVKNGLVGGRQRSRALPPLGARHVLCREAGFGRMRF
jgi:hypothetical protein